MADPRDFLLTKIVATLGPATAQIDSIVRLIEEGVRVFRINFSHGSFDDFGRFVAMVRQAGEETAVPAAVMGDLSGPKIRLGKVAGDGIVLNVGDTVVLQQAEVVAEPDHDGDRRLVFSTTAPQVIPEIEPGQRVLIDDGAVRMVAVDRSEGASGGVQLVCQVMTGGRVSSAKGVNLPDSRLSLPSLTDYDWQCVDWAVLNGVDVLALSFVRKAEDVRVLRQALAERAGKGMQPIPVVAKIEKPQALEELEAIVQESDALMVARGDLGVEMDLARVPVIQKRIIRLGHDYGRPVIVATQMLQSMIEAPAPTRAEVSDVANAIYDGADAVMLSGETAIGKYPVQTVAMMARVARTTLRQMVADEALGTRQAVSARRLDEGRYRTAALARGVATVVGDSRAKLVATWSQRGGGARYLSRNRLGVPIVAASSDLAALRRMNLLFGVIPTLLPLPQDRQDFAAQVDVLLQQRGWAELGDSLVMVIGEPIGVVGVSNSIWLRYVGDVCSLG